MPHKVLLIGRPLTVPIRYRPGGDVSQSMTEDNTSLLLPTAATNESSHRAAVRAAQAGDIVRALLLAWDGGDTRVRMVPRRFTRGAHSAVATCAYKHTANPRKSLTILSTTIFLALTVRLPLKSESTAKLYVIDLIGGKGGTRTLDRGIMRKKLVERSS